MSFPRINYAKDGTRLYCKNLNTNTKIAYAQGSLNILDGDTTSTSYVGKASNETNYRILFNFPDLINISKVGIKTMPASGTGQMTNLSILYSSDSTDGIDGTWVEHNTLFSANDAEYTEWEINISNIKWIAMPSFSGVNSFYSIFIFGEYISPRFEVWDVNGTQELKSGDFTFGITNISSNYDYEGKSSFKVKNTTEYTKNYSISILPLKYGGDTVITDNFFLSKDAGVTKLQSITIYDVLPNTLSQDIIDIYASILAINNPGDGNHLYTVVVEEV